MALQDLAWILTAPSWILCSRDPFCEFLIALWGFLSLCFGRIVTPSWNAVNNDDDGETEYDDKKKNSHLVLGIYNKPFLVLSASHS